MIVVSLGLATICFLNQCYPALVGKTTPTGHYQLRERRVLSPGYGGDVLVFMEERDDLLAIHRVWLGKPSEQRLDRLASVRVERRRGVTGGCINVAPDVYAKLLDCCRNADLTIE